MKEVTRTKIIVLHIFSGDLWAGAEVMIFNLLKRLKNHPDIEVIALSLNKGVLSDKLLKHGIETHIISEETSCFLIIFWKALIKFKNRKIDVIHSHRYKENILALLLSKFLNIRHIVSTFHGWAAEYFKEGQKIRLVTKLDYLIMRYFFSKIVAVSKELKNALIQRHFFCEKKVGVIHNGIVIPHKYRCESQQVSRNFRIGTVGRMMPQKDFNLFLDTAAIIKNHIENVQFSILGEGLLKDRLIKKARDLNIDHDVKFLPHTPDPFSYYYSLDIYLNTSLFEGIPLSILEAMACGKPVIAPKIGGIPEIVSHGKNGFLIDSRRAEQFASSCLKLLSDEGLRREFSMNAVNRITSCFNDDMMAASYLKLYNDF